jgi:hypothetical protein
VLVVEKDGLMPALEAAQIDLEFDIFLGSTQGKGSTALREMIEALAERYPDVTIYTLVDFDRDGIVGANALAGKDTKSYTWTTQPNVIPLGLSLDDVRKFKVEDESVSGMTTTDPRRLLEDAGRTPEEIDYLVAGVERVYVNGKLKYRWRGRRAELNGLIGRAWPDFVRTKLTKAGVQKVVPRVEKLKAAYRRAVVHHRANTLFQDAVAAACGGAELITPPSDLDRQVRRLLEDDVTRSWDDAVAELASEHLEAA